MSGGVDSSVAAALLVEQGYEVVGVFFELCSARDGADARTACERLGIEYAEVDLRERFCERVVEPFVAEYLRGRTPSPCIRCNRLIKFPALLTQAESLGASLTATGHYARVEGCRLFRAVDAGKDQSYFLFELGRAELDRIILPLGRLSKRQVRAKAKQLGLANADKDESQDVCFVANDGYAGFVEARAAERISGPGEFVDVSGAVLGRHSGLHRYTIGQRRGIGFGSGRRRYVVSMDAEDNRIVLGSDEELLRGEMDLAGVSWISAGGARECCALVRIRSGHAGESARVIPLPGERAKVIFHRTVRAIAPGQAAVFYDGDEVIGGGWIDKS